MVFATKTVDWNSQNKFVVFLDIMGFKDLVAKNNHKTIFEIMEKLSVAQNFIQNPLNWEFDDDDYKDQEVFTTSFSDSIMVFSNDDTMRSLELVSSAATYIICEAFKMGIPMKGALAHGEISVDLIKNIYFGQL